MHTFLHALCHIFAAIGLLSFFIGRRITLTERPLSEEESRDWIARYERFGILMIAVAMYVRVAFG
jgi:hypothetical protein